MCYVQVLFYLVIGFESESRRMVAMPVTGSKPGRVHCGRELPGRAGGGKQPGRGQQPGRAGI